jgi:hypothetical protein
MHRRPTIAERLNAPSLEYFEGGDAFFFGLAVFVIAVFGIVPMLLLY